MLEAERSHKQWRKHGLCFVVLISLILVTFLRGNSKAPSVVGIKRCSPLDWIIQLLYIGVCLICTSLAIKIVKKEQALKTKLGKGMVESDLRFQGNTLLKLVIFAFLGGWVSGALGLGGGAIFNPLLLSMGVPPSVSAATGMYMIMFSTAGSSIAYMLYRMLDVGFGLWIGAWCALGSILGLFMLNKITKKYDRQSPIVMVLCFILGISAVLVPIFGAIDLMSQVKQGVNIMEFHSIC